jgi:S-adenosylmethionine-diacylglycerol 3-amino-3-carboxypropyl transferase
MAPRRRRSSILAVGRRVEGTVSQTAPGTIIPTMSGGGIRYSQVWEDHLLLEEGLAVGAADDVLSVTSAGDNVLALLLRGPRSVTAIDCNPAQQALLELKLAAIRRLDHDEFVALLGVRPAPDRVALYRAVRDDLDAATRAFWDANEGLLRAGVVEAGRLETYVRKFRAEYFTRIVPDEAVRRLLEAPDVATQRQVFDAAFKPAERVFRGFFGREELAREGRSPEQFRYVEHLDVGEALWRRFEVACAELPARGNFYLEYLLTWRYGDLDLGPPYLRPANFARLRDLVDRVRVVTDDLGHHLEQAPAGAYSKGNLSDVFEYVSPEESAGLMRSLGRALRPGGRLAFWNLLVPRASPPELRPPFRPLEELSARLWRRDRSWFYQAFHVEETVADA